MRPSDIPLLRAEVEADFSDLERVVSEIRNLKEEIGSSEPGYRDKAALGALLHSFYNGIENVLKRIAEEVDQSVPVGEGWHRALLRRMTREVEEIRPPVLDPETARLLMPYLWFRHFFMHSYTFEIDWAKLKPLVDGLDEAFQRFQVDIRNFFEMLGTFGS